MGYTAWSAGGFSPTNYNLTMTPKGSPGNFIDQQTVSQCVVGTRNGNSNATRTGKGSDGKDTVGISGSSKHAAGGVVGTLVMAVLALVVMG